MKKKAKKYYESSKSKINTHDAILFITRLKHPPYFDKLMNRCGNNVVHLQEENSYVPPQKGLTITGQNQTLYSISLSVSW